ncbi:MAG: 50S ribosomal protein L11 methyltransferase [Burkholderiales bacterium]|nr:50S ribosomal protein L11 methyltransferase [Burkholderiales bacterium]
MVELRLLVGADRVDSLSDALMELEALAVTVEDADVDTDDETPIFGEPGMPAVQAGPLRGWSRSVVKALYDDEAQASEACIALLAWEGTSDVHVQGIESVAELDWVRITQSQFAPVEITPEFWIVPSWHEVPAAARRVIRLDPGLAFGTGTHPTTRMCLRWIARQGGVAGAAVPQRVIDYGCGSGILGIAAALHGAAAVDGVDIDPAAVESARLNAQANGVTLRTGLPEAVQGRYDWVLANILAAPLKLLAPLLCELLAEGGRLVLAGVLERQTTDLQAAYAPWVQLQVADQEDGWVLLTAQLGA